MKHLIFEKPTIAPQLINGIMIDFPFKIIQDGKNYERDIQTDHVFRLGLSTFLLIGWGLNIHEIAESSIVKMAYPFVESIIIDKTNDGTIKEYDEKILTRELNTIPYPYDIDKVGEIEGKTIDFEESLSTIGEVIETNRLADEIVQLRDNINTLFNDKYKENLLFLNEERGILNFFRIVHTEEDFTHRLASLGELIKNINSKKLKSLLKKFEKDDGSVSLLEKFILQLGIKDFELIRILRNINRI